MPAATLTSWPRFLRQNLRAPPRQYRKANMPDTHLKFANLLSSSSIGLLDHCNAMAQRTLDNSAAAARLTLHYLQDVSQANMNTALQRLRQKSGTHLYEFDPASLKVQCALGDDYRANLFTILLDIQRSMVESGSASMYDGYKQFQKLGTY
jgi:hypothetical protein